MVGQHCPVIGGAVAVVGFPAVVAAVTFNTIEECNILRYVTEKEATLKLSDNVGYKIHKALVYESIVTRSCK